MLPKQAPLPFTYHLSNCNQHNLANGASLHRHASAEPAQHSRQSLPDDATLCSQSEDQPGQMQCSQQHEVYCDHIPSSQQGDMQCCQQDQVQCSPATGHTIQDAPPQQLQHQRPGSGGMSFDVRAIDLFQQDTCDAFDSFWRSTSSLQSQQAPATAVAVPSGAKNSCIAAAAQPGDNQAAELLLGGGLIASLLFA